MPLSTLRIHRAVICLAACAAWKTSAAAEWSAQPSIWWYLDYESNRRLALSGETPDEMGSMTVDLLLRRLTETDELTLHPQAQVQRFTRDSALDANNGSLQLLASHKAELWSIASTATVSRESTLITELASTGIVDANSRQDLLSDTLSVTRQFSASQGIEADVSYSDVTYPNGLPAGLVGYHNTGGSFSYVYTYSQRTTWSLVASGTDLLSELGITSKDAGASLQWKHSFTSLLSMTASVGATRARVAGATGSGSVWDLELVRNTERAKWSFTLRRDVEPNGLGVLLSHEELDLSVLRNVAPHLSVTLSAQGIHNENLITGASFGDRSYFAGNAGLEWQLRSYWVLDLTAGYSQATYPTTSTGSDLARGWIGALTLHWTPRPWSVSR